VASVIEVDNVWKRYGNVVALCGISVSVPSQSVYGFLGPNGAGKTTTIRMILGLQRPDRGTVSLFGCSLEKARTTLLRRTGSLVESPSLYPHLTGRENLEVHRRVLGLPKRAVDKALVTVSLLSVASRLVRSYSSGMRQRLGVAKALLGDPELLVLDEPTNGLDPNGIHEIRTLIRDLPHRCGVTVFLSSHLLSEVEQVATQLAIVSHGEMRFAGTQQDLQDRTRPMIEVGVDQPERACDLLSKGGFPTRRVGIHLLVEADRKSGPAYINALLMKAGIAVSHLASRRATLEDFFLELTKDDDNISASALG